MHASQKVSFEGSYYKNVTSNCDSEFNSTDYCMSKGRSNFSISIDGREIVPFVFG